MGQARKRGTYEQRVAAAQVRNHNLAVAVMQSDHPKLKRALRMHGPGQLAAAMISLGAIKPDDTHPKIDWPGENPAADRPGSSAIITPELQERRRIVPARLRLRHPQG